MDFSEEAVLINVRASETNDLLDRCTYFREEMEPAAIEIIEAELRQRGIDEEAILIHAQCDPPVLRFNGLAVKCSFCSRAAVWEGWGWHRLWGLWPIFPTWLYRCPDHV